MLPQISVLSSFSLSLLSHYVEETLEATKHTPRAKIRDHCKQVAEIGEDLPEACLAVEHRGAGVRRVIIVSGTCMMLWLPAPENQTAEGSVRLHVHGWREEDFPGCDWVPG